MEIIQNIQIKTAVQKWNLGECFSSGTQSHGHGLDIVIHDNCIIY